MSDRKRTGKRKTRKQIRAQKRQSLRREPQRIDPTMNLHLALDFFGRVS